MHKHACLLALVPLLFAPPGSAAPCGDGLDQLLDDARGALGRSHWDPLRDLRLSGRATYQGVEEVFEADYAHDGRFRLAFEGDLSRRSRHDGHAVWLAEYSTLWYELEFFDREVELLRGLVHGGAWLDPEAAVDLRPAEDWAPADGRIGLELRLADGLLPARLELDAQDHLVRSMSVPTGNGVLRSEYEDYRAVDGVYVAHRVRCDLSVGSEYAFEVERGGLADSDAARFGRVDERLDYRFDLDVPPAVEVVRSSSKHLWVRPLINGQDVGLFLFDTCAGFSGISREAADALGLGAFGESSLTGLGGGVTETGMRRAERLQLGPLIIDDLVFSEVPVGRKSELVGEKVGGVLGWDVMRRAIVDLEPRGELRLFDPATFELSEEAAGGAWQPMHVHYQVPYVRARFPDDHEGLFMLDCGAAGMTVMFFHHAALALGLLDDDQHAGPESSGEGAGGRVEQRLSELAWFELAGDSMDDMPIILSTAPDGERDPYSLGLIGGGLLRLYRVVFDVTRKRVALLPL